TGPAVVPSDGFCCCALSWRSSPSSIMIRSSRSRIFCSKAASAAFVCCCWHIAAPANIIAMTRIEIRFINPLTLKSKSCPQELEVKTESSGDGPRSHEMRSAESGKEVVHGNLVCQVDHV